MYDQLYLQNAEGEIEWRLLENLEKSDDGLVYTLHVQPEATWSDGEPITSKDIVFSIEYFAERQGGISSITHLKSEEIDINVIDDKTLEIKLPRPSNTYINNLQFLDVIPAHPFDGDASKVDTSTYFTNPDMATSGPYKMVELNPDSYVCKAREDYYRGAPKVETIVMKVLGEGSTKNVSFENGEISYKRIEVAEELEKYKAEADKYNIYSFPEGRTNALILNYKGPNMSEMSKEARQAIFLALDRDEILQIAYGSEELVQPAKSLFTSSHVLYDPTFEGYQQDLEQAQKLADESGLTGKTLVYCYNKDRDNMEQISIAVQQQLAKIGVNLQIEALDSPTFFARVFSKGDNELRYSWDIASNGWGQRRGYGIANIYTTLNDTDWLGYSQEFVDVVEACDMEQNEEKEYELARKVDEMNIDEYVFYPLADPIFTMVTHKNITGLDASKIVPEFADYAAITIE